MLPSLQSLDWQRMFFGDAPPEFLVEIVVRTCVVYLYSLLLIRWIGGRGIGQMSVVEFLLVVALGSAVGDAMFYPDVPLAHAMLVITVVILINKLIDIGIWADPRIRRIFNGKTVPVVENGRINLASLRYQKISREELFEGLRDKGIRNLGRIEYAFLESSGTFSVFRVKGRVSGLPIVPPNPTDTTARPGPRLCANCAAVVPEPASICPECAGTEFTAAETEAENG
jgi:uncharacterized membrane protein YcaP (DUF421 family)